MLLDARAPALGLEASTALASTGRSGDAASLPTQGVTEQSRKAADCLLAIRGLAAMAATANPDASLTVDPSRQLAPKARLLSVGQGRRAFEVEYKRHAGLRAVDVLAPGAGRG